ncbi:MAG: hypothetical protein RLY43_1548 [Bacteroidota bacterium]|jgi:uncharacterized membrane protein YedE/YeeE
MNILFDTWHWSFSGLAIGIIMLVLTYFGKTFGMSSNLRTLCSMTPAKKQSSYFDFNWKEQRWNLAIVLGAIAGGFFAYHYMMDSSNILQLNPKTLTQLQQLHIDAPQGKLVPDAIFSLDTLFSVKGFLIVLLGGFLIGFGTPYAGGCTSGHAISGLSNLQIPSLIAVIGFFIGGLIAAHFIIPLLFN